MVASTLAAGPGGSARPSPETYLDASSTASARATNQRRQTRNRRCSGSRNACAHMASSTSPTPRPAAHSSSPKRSPTPIHLGSRPPSTPARSSFRAPPPSPLLTPARTRHRRPRSTPLSRQCHGAARTLATCSLSSRDTVRIF